MSNKTTMIVLAVSAMVVLCAAAGAFIVSSNNGNNSSSDVADTGATNTVSQATTIMTTSITSAAKADLPTTSYGLEQLLKDGSKDILLFKALEGKTFYILGGGIDTIVNVNDLETYLETICYQVEDGCIVSFDTSDSETGDLGTITVSEFLDGEWDMTFLDDVEKAELAQKAQATSEKAKQALKDTIEG